MKVRIRKIPEKDRIKYLDALYTAVTSLKSREEVKNLFKDLLTISEKIMLGRRIVIAQKLLEGDSYDKIMSDMRVGADTIMRVHHWLLDGSGGYEKTIGKLEKEMKLRKREFEYADPFSFEGLKKKYPLHFLLFNIFDKLTKK